MKKLRVCSSVVLLVMFLSFSIGAQVDDPYRKVKVKKENLRNAPKGKKLAEILKNTRMRVLEEKGKWVKVQITGWIWKASTALSKPPLAEMKLYPREEYLKEADNFAAKLSLAVEDIKRIIRGYEFGTVSRSRLYQVMEPYAKLTTPEIFSSPNIKFPSNLIKLRDSLLTADGSFKNIIADFNPLSPEYKKKKPKIDAIKKQILQYEKDIANYTAERSRFK